MKDFNIVDIIDELLDEDTKVIEEFIKHSIDPIADVGSPEKLIGKLFKDWTQADKQWAVSVYGMNNQKLNKLAFEDEYAKLGVE